MRFFLADGLPPALDEMMAALKIGDPGSLLVRDSAETGRGDLYFGDVLYAEIELNAPGDEIFDEDCGELAEELDKQDDPGAEEAKKALAEATGAVVLHVFEPGHDDYARLNLLIDWLFETRTGVLQVDEEGFFGRDGKKIVALL